MSEDQQSNELDILKFRAKQIGVKFREDIGIETLRKRIEDHLSGNKDDGGEEGVTTQSPKKARESNDVLIRRHLQKEQMKLVRIRISNLDPKKRDIPGEIISVSNHYLGTVKKYVPYGEHSEEGYHVEKCLYTFLKNRRFLSIRTVKDKNSPTGVRIQSDWVPEYSIEVLPDLTQKELDRLAAKQAAAGRLD